MAPMCIVQRDRLVWVGVNLGGELGVTEVALRSHLFFGEEKPIGAPRAPLGKLSWSTQDTGDCCQSTPPRKKPYKPDWEPDLRRA